MPTQHAGGGLILGVTQLHRGGNTASKPTAIQPRQPCPPFFSALSWNSTPGLGVVFAYAPKRGETKKERITCYIGLLFFWVSPWSQPCSDLVGLHRHPPGLHKSCFSFFWFSSSSPSLRALFDDFAPVQNWGLLTSPGGVHIVAPPRLFE